MSETYESRVRGQSSRVQVGVLSRESGLSSVSVLAAQVTSLAGLRLGGIAGRSLAAHVRVQMSAGTSAVAVRRNRLSVEVVHERTASLGKASEGDLELDALAVGAGGGLDGSGESAALLGGKSTDVLGAHGVAHYDGSGSALGGDSGGRGQNGDD